MKNVKAIITIYEDNDMVYSREHQGLMQSNEWLVEIHPGGWAQIEKPDEQKWFPDEGFDPIQVVS